MSGISFEWAERNADRINAAFEDAFFEQDVNPAQTILAFVTMLALNDNDYAYISYDITDAEFGEIMEKTLAFLRRAGIKYC